MTLFYGTFDDPRILHITRQNFQLNTKIFTFILL